WYILIEFHPEAFPLLQIAHALQYLVFPMRVEFNQYSEKSTQHGHPLRHVVLYYGSLVVAGLLVFDIPLLLEPLGDTGGRLALLIAGLINVHHYFTDGVIWKIREPGVRHNLFGHLPPV
ncbi:MAG: hypothetical protein ACC652_15750, partial [Acidimicrobiales bacterium]